MKGVEDLLKFGDLFSVLAVAFEDSGDVGHGHEDVDCGGDVVCLSVV